MSLIKKTIFLTVVLAVTGLAWVHAGKNKKIDLSVESITPVEAYRMLKSGQEKVFLIDVRSRFEYEFIGHPPIAYNIPYKFRYPAKWILNPNFIKNIEEKFKKDDILTIMCRSGPRSKKAREVLSKSGYKNIFFMVGGFEGDIATDTESLHYGHRSYVNGWKHAGLPYTYKVEKKYVYSPGEPCDCDEEHEKLDRKAIEK